MDAQARLSKDKRRFLCFPKDCGAELAGPVGAVGGLIWRDADDGYILDKVILPDGLVLGEDGIWDWSLRSKKRMRLGQQAGFRRAINGMTDDDGERVHRAGGPLGLEAGRRLPIRRRCPTCGLINTIPKVHTATLPSHNA